MNSVIKPAELFSKVKELGQPAVAVTDYGTMAGAWDSLKASKKTGVKLLMGCNFNFVDDLSTPGKSRHLILIAKNYEGYKNLLKASKLANDNYIVAFKKVVPRIDWNTLAECSEGLICTTAGSGGILGQLINTRKAKEAKVQAQRLKEIFGDSLAFEIQPHAMLRNASPYNDYEDQRLVNNRLVKFGDELGVKVVPATGAHYLSKDQWEMHDALLSIGSGMPARARARLKFNVNDFFVKTRDQVATFLRRYYKERAEEFCDNTLFFSDMCEDPKWIDPKYSNPSGKELPEFPVHDQDDYVQFRNWFAAKSVDPNSDIKIEMPEDVAYMRYWCLNEFAKKVPAGKEQQYMEALKEEFDVIEFHGFSSYMLIVADYIQFCKKNLIPVGPGRGSVGGSLIAFLMGIHQADPIKYDLIFARFHNKSKTSFPDIDTDFAPSGRPKVQQYIIDKYGEDKVAHVSNLNTMTPKVYARDIARAFEYGGNRSAAAEVGANIADAIPSEIKTVHSALERAPLFEEYAKNERYSELKKFADLGGIERAWSTHAGGLVISKRPLAEFVPVRRDKEGNVAIEYEKNRAEDNGLVKMDTLGLETLDIIRNTYHIIEMTGKELPPIVPDYDEYDQITYDLISRGDTLCVFQLGTSAGTIDLCKRVAPKCIEDISIINSLARPSARDIRQKFIATKDGKKDVEILHPALNRAFRPTYGFGLYEECLMYLAQDVAGWTLHEADGLRKLTKEKGKNPKKAAKLKQDFIDGSMPIVGMDMGTKIWDEVVDKFQGYGFNHSHSILYSFISYHTAYLKAHFPLEFMVANLMSEVDSNAKVSGDNINKIKNEIRRSGVKIQPPNINSSGKSYKIVDNNTLLTGLNSLKYMGKDAIPEILKHRPFSSFNDMLSKVDGRKLRVTAIYAMASSGCMDDFGLTRKQIYLYASDYKKKLQTWKKKNTEDPFVYPWPDDIGEWTLAEKYAMENYYLGEGLCCGINDAYPGFFDELAIDLSTLPDIFPEPGSSNEKYFIHANIGVVEGVIKNIFEFKVRKETSKIFGQTMAKVELEDPLGHTVSMTIFPGGLELFRERLRILTRGKAEFEPGIAIHCAASINWYEGEASLIFENLKNAAPIPPRPKDLKPRKVSMRIAKKKKKEKVSKLDPLKFLEEIEDELIEEGHSDIEYE
jgi:DNA polymerase-3 subunit alpha